MDTKTADTKPWLPISLLKIILKDKSMSPRWCRKDLFEKRRLEGWVPVSYKELSAESSLTMQDGESLDTTVQRRNLILCKMPKSIVKSRNEFYANLTKDALQNAVNDLGERLKVAGYNSGTTGKLEVYEGSKEVNHGK